MILRLMSNTRKLIPRITELVVWELLLSAAKSGAISFDKPVEVIMSFDDMREFEDKSVRCSPGRQFGTIDWQTGCGWVLLRAKLDHPDHEPKVVNGYDPLRADQRFYTAMCSMPEEPIKP